MKFTNRIKNTKIEIANPKTNAKHENKKYKFQIQRQNTK